MGTEAAHRPQEVLPLLEGGIGEELFGPLVGDGGPLELEEQDVGGHVGGVLLDVLQEGTSLGVAGVGGEVQIGEGLGLLDLLLDALQLLDSVGQTGGVEIADLSVEP